MKDKKFNNKYYERILKFEKDKKYSHEHITSDFSMLIMILFEFLVYLVFLIPNLALLIFYMVTVNKDKMNSKFDEIVIYPFRIFWKIHAWFFEAKYTAFLILLLVFMFVLELVFLNSYMKNLEVHTAHLITGVNYYSTFTSIFLHANLIHLLTNLLALLIFGRQVEKNMGFKVILIFVFSGIIANVVSNIIAYNLGYDYYSLGASGAIAGLIIFAILLEPFALTSVFIIPIPIFIIGWFLIFLDVVGLFNDSQTNHLAHLGGYLALLVLFFFLEFKYREKIMKGFYINLAMIVMFFVVYNVFGLSFVSGLGLF